MGRKETVSVLPRRRIQGTLQLRNLVVPGRDSMRAVPEVHLLDPAFSVVVHNRLGRRRIHGIQSLS